MTVLEHPWTPSCIGRLPQRSWGSKWRIMRHDGHDWFDIEVNDGTGWQGGLAGTVAWLGLTDEEVAKSYVKKAA